MGLKCKQENTHRTFVTRHIDEVTTWTTRSSQVLRCSKMHSVSVLLSVVCDFGNWQSPNQILRLVLVPLCGSIGILFSVLIPLSKQHSCGCKKTLPRDPGRTSF
ncbi:hypothetical protein BDW72DRAFT_167465 [Aspergillus terricola var. indicus]